MRGDTSCHVSVSVEVSDNPPNSRSRAPECWGYVDRLGRAGEACGRRRCFGRVGHQGSEPPVQLKDQPADRELPSPARFYTAFPVTHPSLPRLPCASESGKTGV